MSIVQEYEAFRRASRELNSQVMEKSLSRKAIDRAGNLLGIVRDNTFVFSDEDETSILMDFALHDCRDNGQNAFEVYRETVGWRNETEKAILDAFLASYSSLFRVTSVVEAEATMLLRDLLNQRDNLTLVDIGFSRTSNPGLLLFTRLVPFADDLNMTSGIALVFPSSVEAYLLRRYKRLARKVQAASDPVKRFVAFFELHQECGLPVRYEL